VCNQSSVLVLFLFLYSQLSLIVYGEVLSILEGIVLTLYNDAVIVAAAKFNVKRLELQDSSTSTEQVDNHCI
jgi:uncharacterized integral membrane protein